MCSSPLSVRRPAKQPGEEEAKVRARCRSVRACLHAPVVSDMKYTGPKSASGVVRKLGSAAVNVGFGLVADYSNEL